MFSSLTKKLIILAFVIAFAMLAINVIGTDLIAEEKEEKDKITIQLRWDHQFQFAGYYAALKQGYYDDANLEVEIKSALTKDGVILSATREVDESRAEFGVGSADILVANDKGANLRVAFVVMQRSAARFYLKEEKPFNHVSDFVKMKVARNVNDLIDVEFQAMLINEGVDVNDIDTYPHQQGIQHLQDDVVDVVPGYNLGFTFQADERGVAIKEVNPQDYGVDFYGDSLFVNGDFANENPEITQRFIEASLKGWEYAMENTDEIAELISSEYKPVQKYDDYLSYNKFQADIMEDLLVFPVIEIGHVNPFRWQKMHSILSEFGIVSNQLDLSWLIYDLERIEADRRDFRNKVTLIVVGTLGAVLFSIIIWTVLLRRMVKYKTSELEKTNERLQKSNRVLAITHRELEEEVYNRAKIEAELVQAKDNAEAASRTKSRFLANMSHEIRTPMNGMIGMIDLTMMGALDQEQREQLVIAKKSANTLVDILNDILDISSVEEGKIQLNYSYNSLEELIQSVLELYKPLADGKGIHITSEIDERLPSMIHVDPKRFKQVCLNLLGNAIKFTYQGNVKLKIDVLEILDEKVKIQFSCVDTGIGISHEDIDIIFNRFSQVDNSKNRVSTGVGLGLTICRQLINLMGGELKCESQLGNGSTFFFDLDLAYEIGDKHDVREEEVKENILEPQNLKVLVVDDDIVNGKILTAFFSKEGHKCLHALSGKEAIDIFNSFKPELVLMDISMPVMDGVEAMQKIKELKNYNDEIIIAQTAFAFEDDKKEIIQEGFDGYVAKPIDFDELRSLIRGFHDKLRF